MTPVARVSAMPLTEDSAWRFDKIVSDVSFLIGKSRSLKFAVFQQSIALGLERCSLSEYLVLRFRFLLCEAMLAGHDELPSALQASCIVIYEKAKKSWYCEIQRPMLSPRSKCRKRSRDRSQQPCHDGGSPPGSEVDVSVAFPKTRVPLIVQGLSQILSE